MLKKSLSIVAIILLSACGGGGSSTEVSSGPTYPANGTKSGNEYCGTDDNEWTLYQDYHNGSGGTYTSVVEENSLPL